MISAIDNRGSRLAAARDLPPPGRPQARGDAGAAASPDRDLEVGPWATGGNRAGVY